MANKKKAGYHLLNNLSPLSEAKKEEDKQEQQPARFQSKVRPNTQVARLTNEVLKHIQHASTGRAVGGLLLAGDPGIGKTSFVETFSELLGIKAVVIEVPHITEEHIINIPFIVFKSLANTQQTGITHAAPKQTGPGSEYSLELADSNLYTQLVRSVPYSEPEYLQYMQSTKAPPHVKQLYTQMGGTQDKIPMMIRQARQHITVILFLDEYYRETSPRIRNMLRDLLNKRLGMHRLPNSVYCIYASNMKDDALSSIPTHNQFYEVAYQAPTKNEWFEWLIGKYLPSTEIKLDDRVMQAYQQAMSDEDISFEDTEASVRTSPRRWEQMMLAINASLPVKNIDDAKTLMTFVKNNFINYETEKHSTLAEKITKVTADVIKITSNIEIKPTDVTAKHDWRTVLEHTIELQKKLGKARKHIPVVSGPPGIGKTWQAAEIAEEHGLRLIDIQATNFSSEDVQGIPIPGAGTGKGRTIEFALPKLYHQIMSDIKKADEDYEQELREEYGNEAQKHIEAYHKQRWKYLLLIDEINRVEDVKTLNALRKVILEKDFGPAGDNTGEHLRLPKETIVISAINPSGEGTVPLTSHFRDVIDFIPAVPRWELTKAWLQKHEAFAKVDKNIKETGIGLLDALTKKFGDTDHYSKEEAPYHLMFGGAGDVYVAPREYQDIFNNVVSAMEDIKDYPHELPQEEFEVEVIEAVADGLIAGIRFPLRKSEKEMEEIELLLRDWVYSLQGTVFRGIMGKIMEQGMDIDDVLEQYLSGKKKILKMQEDPNIFNINETLSDTQFISEFSKLLVKVLSDEKEAKRIVLDKVHPKVAISKDEQLTTDEGQKVDLLTNFILALLFTMHLQGYNNNRLNGIGRGFSNACQQTFEKAENEQMLPPEEIEDIKQTTVSTRVALTRFVKQISEMK